MKKYFFDLGLKMLASVLVVASLFVYFILRSSGIELFSVSGDYLKAKSVFYGRDGSVFADFDISEADKRALYISAEADGKVTLGRNEYRAEVKESPEGDILITLSPKISVYSTMRAVLTAAALTVAAAFLAALFFVIKRAQRDVTEPLKNLSMSLKSVENGDYECLIKEEGVGEIAELTKAAERLRCRLKNEVLKSDKAEEDRSFLISSVSHDLRTPVAAVRGYLEGIRDSVADTPEKREKYLDKAIDRLDTVKNMIDDLLLYSRLDSGRADYEPVRTELFAYLSDFAEEESYGFLREGKTLRFKSELKKAVVILDPEKFARVLGNITQNAKRYIKEGTGWVEIILRRNLNAAIVEIKDNGEGMEKEELSKIFDRFYRVSKARTSDGSTGLGLAISKKIVEDMGGRIWAVSEKGKGTAFMISLKLLREDNDETDFNN